MRQLDDQVSVSPQIQPSDVARLKDMGFRMIVNNRPDDEDAGQPAGAEIERAAKEVGLEYRAVPIIRGIGAGDVEAMQEALEACGNDQLLAFCRSGNRSALAWAVARRKQGVDRSTIEDQARQAGIDLTPVDHLL